MILNLDIETYSEVELSSAGVYVYAAHPSTELLLFCWAFDDEPVATWRPGEPLPERVVQHIDSHGQIRAHNASFERVVLNGVAGQKVGFPPISIEQTVCVAAKAAAHGLPRALANAAKALGVREKDAAGRIVMLQLSKPRRGAVKRYTPANAPEKFAALAAYCANDVEVERAIDKAIPDLPEIEQKVYELDQRINDRGVRVDRPALTAALELLDQYKDELLKECIALTQIAPTQREKLAGWLREHGLQFPDLQAETIRRLLASGKGSEQCRRVLQIYGAYNSKSVSKLESMLEGANEDDRIRGMFLYYGASTGRWSSQRVQLQNMLRGEIKNPDEAIDVILGRDLRWLQTLYADKDPIKVIGSCARGMIVPAEGKSLMALDYSGIESRVNAWIFDEEWKIEAFRDYDAGNGPGIYELVYAQAFHKHAARVTPEERQIGKVLELSSGFQGGVSAFVKMAHNYSVDLDAMAKAVIGTIPEDVLSSARWMWHNHAKPKNATFGLSEQTYVVCDSLKQLWRSSNPKITAGWKALEEGAVNAIEAPGKVFTLPNKKLAFKVDTGWLYMRLPSGRKLAYYQPAVESGRLSYMGTDTLTRQWCRTQMYGGMLCNNAVQGTARDIMVNGLMRIEGAGWPVVMTIHDELVVETDEPDLKQAAEIMCTLSVHDTGLPLAVKGWIGKRYRK